MVTRQLQVRCRSGKARRSKTDVLPLSYTPPTITVDKASCGLAAVDRMTTTSLPTTESPTSRAVTSTSRLTTQSTTVTTQSPEQISVRSASPRRHIITYVTGVSINFFPRQI